jgi:hypothetical protein
MSDITPERYEQVLANFEKTARQMAAVFGEDSDAGVALQQLDLMRENGLDYVVVFTETQWIVGPRPSFDDLLGRY